MVFSEIRGKQDCSEYETSGYIGAMYIEEKYRSKGVGKLILDEFIKWFKENDIKDVRIKVYQKNKKAIEVYKKMGFENIISEMRLVLD